MSKQIPIQRKKFQYYSQRMAGYDQIGQEVIQVFLLKMLINMVMKYKSTNKTHRKDGF